MRNFDGLRPERLTATAVIVIAIALTMGADLLAGADAVQTPGHAAAARPEVLVTARARSAHAAAVRRARRRSAARQRATIKHGAREAPATSALATAKNRRARTRLSPATHEPASGSPSASAPTSTTFVASPPSTTPRDPDANETVGPPEPAPRSRSIYWGATIGSQLTGEQAPWDMQAVTQFESRAGKPMAIVNWNDQFYSRGDCNGYCKFDARIFNAVRDHGSIPMLSWATQPSTGAFTDAQIAAGAQDDYLRTWATDAKQWGHPMLLRLAWEMNGSWFPWGVGANGTTAADYTAMWRHVHDIFTAVGADNVSWVWCPNVDLDNLAPLASLYPGDAYVDWTGLDGYNWGTNPAGHNGGWESFDRIFNSTYHAIADTIAPSKPMIVSETGSTEIGGSKAAWITDMLTVQLAHNYPKIYGLLWFDRSGVEADDMDWPIESSASAQNAFSSGISGPIFVTNQYAELGRTKVVRP